MQIVSPQILKQISIGKEKVKVTTQGGGEWELTPDRATLILDHVTTLPPGRQVELKLMSENRNIFDRLHKETKSNVKIRKKAVEKPLEDKSE